MDLEAGWLGELSQSSLIGYKLQNAAASGKILFPEQYWGK